MLIIREPRINEAPTGLPGTMHANGLPAEKTIEQRASAFWAPTRRETADQPMVVRRSDEPKLMRRIRSDRCGSSRPQARQAE